MPIKILKCNRRWTNEEVQDYLRRLFPDHTGPWGAFVQPYMTALGKAGAFGPDWIARHEANRLERQQQMPAPGFIFIYPTAPEPEPKPKIKPKARRKPKPRPIPQPVQPVAAKPVPTPPPQEPEPPKPEKKDPLRPIPHWSENRLPRLLSDEAKGFIIDLLREDQRELENMERIVALRQRHGIEDRFDDFGSWDDIPFFPRKRLFTLAPRAFRRGKQVH